MSKSLWCHICAFLCHGKVRRSPPWELELRPLGVATGNVIPTSPCWGECKPISQKRRALSQLSRLKEVSPGTADGCQWYYPLRPKARAAYPSTYLLGTGITGPRVELKVLESEKIPSRGYGQAPGSLGPGRSLRGYHLLLTEGTVSTDLLVVYTPFSFFFSFLDPTHMGQGSKTGALTNSKKGTKLCA